MTAKSPPEPLRGPSFGTYLADDVGWLLTDLSGVALEAPVEEREEAVQVGGAHYAESLPIEYQPGPEYLRLYEKALDTSATRLAHAVGVVAEKILARRGSHVVLVSLARAGTPVGVLLRRWAAQVHDLDLAHYAVSIVRGKGIDTLALRWLADRHDPASVIFVDGWTGKGAITRELTTALDRHALDTGTRFGDDLAVLADPGRCATLAGTREDWLVPSACLNATVSGLVSRTVLHPRWTGPGRYHGAKFYRELLTADVSRSFVDAVVARFPDVRDAARAASRIPDGVPDGAGRAAVERIATAYGIDDVNLVKPGVGETTRVLLRRVPWRILVRAGAPAADLAHVRLLAAERGVEVEEVDGLLYNCVGVIHPRYTRNVIGADGMAAGR